MINLKMKLITVFAPPKAYPVLSTALRRARVSGITVSKVEGYGAEHLSADMDLFGHLNPKMKVEIAVDQESCEKVIELVRTTIQGSDTDSGTTIFVSNLEEVIKVPRKRE